MDNEKLKEEGIEYPIKLEYYKTISNEENVKARYGIEIVKTEFIAGNVKVESSSLDNVTDSVENVEQILVTLRNNEVTPICLQDVLDDMFIKD